MLKHGVVRGIIEYEVTSSQWQSLPMCLKQNDRYRYHLPSNQNPYQQVIGKYTAFVNDMNGPVPLPNKRYQQNALELVVGDRGTYIDNKRYMPPESVEEALPTEQHFAIRSSHPQQHQHPAGAITHPKRAKTSPWAARSAQARRRARR